jgi:hypothetical protein
LVYACVFVQAHGVGDGSVDYSWSQHFHFDWAYLPTAESGQRILLDTQLGLNKNLTAAEIQLIGPVLPILKADTSMDRDFILLEQEDKSILL